MALYPLSKKMAENKTNKTLMYITGILFVLTGLVVILYFVMKAKKKKELQDHATVVEDIKSVNATGVVKPSSKQNSNANLDLVLKKGSNSPEVGTLQAILNLKGAGLAVDNAFGQKTEDALVAQTGRKQTTLNQMSSSVLGLSLTPEDSGLFSWFS